MSEINPNPGNNPDKRRDRGYKDDEHKAKIADALRKALPKLASMWSGQEAQPPVPSEVADNIQPSESESPNQQVAEINPPDPTPVKPNEEARAAYRSMASIEAEANAFRKGIRSAFAANMQNPQPNPDEPANV